MDTYDYVRDIDYNPVNTVEVLNVNDHNGCWDARKDRVYFKLYHQNINSLNKNIDEIKILLSQINCEYDCIIFTESYKIFDTALFQLPDYEMIYNDGEFNKNDGVVVYLKKTLNFSYKSIFIGYCKALQINISIEKHKNIIMTTLYRSPSASEEIFVNELGLYLDLTKQLQVSSHLLVGDINIKINQTSETVNNYLNLLNEYNFISMINKNTRLMPDGTGNCLDHIFMKSNIKNFEKECLSMVFDNNITDHRATILGLPIQTFKNPDIVSNKNIDYTNYGNLRNDLENYNWNNFYNITDVNNLVSEFISLLRELVIKNTFTKKIGKENIKRKKWITAGIVISVNKKNRLYHISKLDPLNEQKRSDYLNYKKKLKTLIRNAKYNYFKKLININKNTSKNLWNVIKNICVNTEKKEATEIVTTKNVTCNTPQTIAEAFNDFFVNIGESYANEITKPKTPLPLTEINSKSFFLHPVNTKEILDIIKSLKNKKSPGFDNIKTEIFKETANIIVQPICHIINRIFASSKVPDEFKIAVVTPIHKKGELKNINNYRPISVITVLAKIFEKALKCRLSKFFKDFNIISEKQFGFREGLSTNDAIGNLVNEITKCLEVNKPVLCVFLDLAKAFDTVSHTQMLETLEAAGIRGEPRKLFADYLSNRRQVVKIDKIFSKEKIINYGLPQGTVLGPILFTLYINNILSSTSSGKLFSFADDTAVLYSDTDWDRLKTNAESDLCKFFDWFKHKLLTVNYEKTFFMPFSNNSRCLPTYQYLTIKNHTEKILLKSKSSLKYLGVALDSHLRWDIHIDNITKLLRQLLYRFKYLKKCIDQKHLKILYYSLVESRLRYAILSWGGAAFCHLKQLDVIQKRILKIIFNKVPTYPSNMLFFESGILDLRQLFMYQIILYIYKNKNILEKVSHSYTTRYRDNDNVRIELLQKNISLRCYTHLSRKIYNYLPDIYKKYLHKINSTNMIKDIFKKYIILLGRDNTKKLIEIQYI